MTFQVGGTRGQPPGGRLAHLAGIDLGSILTRVAGSRVYDLSVDLFIGMPSFQAAGDPGFQMWMSHTPGGTVIDNANGVGNAMNTCVGYSGDVVLMYTHTGTHIDALNHFGYGDEIHGGFNAREHLGSRGWTRGGVDEIPPILARALLLDVARLHGVPTLPPSYEVTIEDCKNALQAGGVRLGEGDVALVRTGQMRSWPSETVLSDTPGLGLDAAQWLTDQGIVAVGADNGSVEKSPSSDPSNWLPGHTHFLAEAGVPMFELLNLEDLGADQVTESLFIATPLKIRGATGSPVRPIALPLHPAPTEGMDL